LPFDRSPKPTALFFHVPKPPNARRLKNAVALFPIFSNSTKKQKLKVFGALQR
jgi:hypothetical protein